MTAARLAGIRPSLTKGMTQLAREMRDQGRSIITLSQGEPDFDTPQDVREAAIVAINEGRTRYTAVPGVMELRQAIVNELKAVNNLSYTPDQITVGCGAKQVIFNALLASLNSGDEVIIPAPCWVSYPDMVALAGGRPVIITCPEEQGFKLTPATLEQAITSRTRLLLINSPCNPTGAVYAEEELLKLAAVIRRHPSILILTDDIYSSIVYEGAAANMAAVAPDLIDRILIVNGPSKSAAMTGWRVGYGAGPVELIAAMNLIQSQTSSHTSSISQYAAIQAIAGPQAHKETFLEAFRERRDLTVERVSKIPGLRVLSPEGAFYLFINCAGVIGRTTVKGIELRTDEDVAMYLLDEAGVALVPGCGFLMSPYLRLSFASAPKLLIEACDRIECAIRAIC